MSGSTIRVNFDLIGYHENISPLFPLEIYLLKDLNLTKCSIIQMINHSLSAECSNMYASDYQLLISVNRKPLYDGDYVTRYLLTNVTFQSNKSTTNLMYLFPVLIALVANILMFGFYIIHERQKESPKKDLIFLKSEGESIRKDPQITDKVKRKKKTSKLSLSKNLRSKSIIYSKLKLPIKKVKF